MCDHFKGPLGLKRHHVKGCVPGPALCLRKEWRLRHSSTVVAGKLQGPQAVQGPDERTCSQASEERTNEGARHGHPLGLHEGTRAFANVRASQQTKSMKTNTRSVLRRRAGIPGDQYGNTDATIRPYNKYKPQSTPRVVRRNRRGDKWTCCGDKRT